MSLCSRCALLLALVTGLAACLGSLVPDELPEEVCDGVDNDLDDVADEDFECVLGRGEACTLAGTSCSGGMTCDDQCSWGECANLAWQCTSPGEASSCTAHGSCTGTAPCADDCTLGECTNPAWECTSPGSDEACLVGACAGVTQCQNDCSYATCVEACPLGEDCCPAGCVDLDADGANCGICSRVCSDGDCHGGACCIKSCRNGSEVCDDEAFLVPSPYTTMYLVCRNANGGVAYVATNTGPQMSDGIHRCQGWEELGQDAWDYLNYIATLTCNTTGQMIEVDLSSYAGTTLYVGAHDLPAGGGNMTDVCIATGHE